MLSFYFFFEWALVTRKADIGGKFRAAFSFRPLEKLLWLGWAEESTVRPLVVLTCAVNARV